MPIPGLMGLIIIALCAAVASWAKRSGHRYFNWFVISLLITPLLSALMLTLFNAFKNREIPEEQKGIQGIPEEQKGIQRILKMKIGWRFWLIVIGLYIITCIFINN